jgi:Domain of unknown function (DUF5658)
MNAKRATVAGLIVFSILSLADLCLTWVLIRYSGGRVQESNPLAQAWLAKHGWQGMVGFKMATISVFLAVVFVVSCYRPRTSLVLVLFACLSVGSVVLYSCHLLVRAFG